MEHLKNLLWVGSGLFLVFVVCAIISEDSSETNGNGGESALPSPTLTDSEEQERCEDEGLDYLEEVVKDRKDGAKIVSRFVLTHPTGDMAAHVYYNYEGHERVAIADFFPKNCAVRGWTFSDER